MSGDEDGKEERDATLGWRDYIALFIAFIETIGLPLLIMVAVILVILAVVR